mgnify:CR=1 FL=1
MKNFALIGAAGYIAPRHMQAIHDTENNLLAAVDPHDCVGRIDSFFPEAKFFTEIELFEKHLELANHNSAAGKIDYVSICTPNYLHDPHIRLALRSGANAICEKPLVLNPNDLEGIRELEAQHGRRVYNILQLRLLKKLQQLHSDIRESPAKEKSLVDLTYITRRGSWYDVSWKGDPKKSGGPSMNIGVHFFDLLLWLFGAAEKIEVHLKEPRKMSGFLELERSRVRWFLSVDETDLPDDVRLAGKFAYRSMTLDGEEIEFSDGFTDLHTRAYQEILAGNGFGIEEATSAINLTHRINAEPIKTTGNMHPFLTASSTSPRGSFIRAAS